MTYRARADKPRNATGSRVKKGRRQPAAGNVNNKRKVAQMCVTFVTFGENLFKSLIFHYFKSNRHAPMQHRKVFS